MFRTNKRDELYHIDASLGSVRLRGSLGTANKDVAYKLRGRLEYAVSGGPNSPEWSALKGVLPAGTFKRFTRHVGLKVQAEHTVGNLLSIFRTSNDSKVSMRKLAVSTELRYRRVAELFVEWAGEDTLLEDCNKPLVEIYKEQRLKDILLRKNSRDGSSLDLEVAILHMMFAVAVERGWLTKNPVTPGRTPGSSPSRGADPFSPEEMQALDENADPHRLDYLLLRWTGLRGSDITSLTWGEVDFRRQVIAKRSQKTGVLATIPLQAELWRTLVAEKAIAKRLTVSDAGSRQVLYTRIVAMGKRAGIERCIPHAFRDSLAVELLTHGAGIYDVARILGDDVKTVHRHYAPFTPELVDRVRKIMNKG